MVRFATKRPVTKLPERLPVRFRPSTKYSGQRDKREAKSAVDTFCVWRFEIHNTLEMSCDKFLDNNVLSGALVSANRHNFCLVRYAAETVGSAEKSRKHRYCASGSGQLANHEGIARASSRSRCTGGRADQNRFCKENGFPHCRPA